MENYDYSDNMDRVEAAQFRHEIIQRVLQIKDWDTFQILIKMVSGWKI